MAQYQGHKSWNAWNVSLWLNNDEGLYEMAREYYQEARRKFSSDVRARQSAAMHFVADMGPTAKTPDGARYNRTCVYEALEGILD